jgi:hypothetical protein
LKHGLTKEATQDIAKLVNVVSENNFASTSMHKIEKDFSSDECSFKLSVQDSVKMVISSFTCLSTTAG